MSKYVHCIVAPLQIMPSIHIAIIMKKYNWDILKKKLS